MKRTAIFCILSAGLALPGSTEALSARGAGIAGSDPIRISWSGNPGPQKILFDGGPEFDPRPGYFEAPRPAGPGAVISNVVIRFAGMDVPLRLVIRPGNRPISFTVAAPGYTGCDLVAIGVVSRAADSGTIDERVNLLIRARRLIDLCENYPYEVPKLVRKYFSVSCSLAGDQNSFFAIHDDAKNRFQSLQRTALTARSESDCRGRGIGPAYAEQWSSAKKLVQGGEYAAATVAIDDLIEKTKDPLWQDALEANGLDADSAIDLKVISLKAEQNAAAIKDPARAIALNDQLLALEKEFDGLLARNQLTVAGLEKDRKWFNSIQAATAAAQ